MFLSPYERCKKRNKRKFSVRSSMKWTMEHLRQPEFGTQWKAPLSFGCSFHTVVEIDILSLSTFQPDICDLCRWLQHIHILKLETNVNQSFEYFQKYFSLCFAKYKLYLPTVSKSSKRTAFTRLWVRNLNVPESITAGLTIRSRVWLISEDWLTAVCQFVIIPISSFFRFQPDMTLK